MGNQLITGEFTDHPNLKLIEEYNRLTYELNREIGKLTMDEVIKKYNRVVYLSVVLTNEQLSLF